MGHLLGHGIRFGTALDVVAAGEGLETMLSLRSILPTMPLVAALPAAHLAALLPSLKLRRLYVACDNDPAGRWATEQLSRRAVAGRIEALTLTPSLGDSNEDLRDLGATALIAAVRLQLAREDVERFIESVRESTGGG